MPVWFKLPAGFWKELTDLCRKTGIKPEKLIHRGLKLCRKELEGQLKPGSKVAEGEWINSAYWKSITPEERKEKGRRAAMARWHKAERQPGGVEASTSKVVATETPGVESSQKTKRRPPVDKVR